MSSLTKPAGSRHPRSDGQETRQRIIAELRRKRALGLDAPVPIDFARELGISRTNLNHHLKQMSAEVAVRDATKVLPCKRIYLLDDAPNT